MPDPVLRRGLAAVALVLALGGGATAAEATTLKLWPLFEYEHDAAAGTRSVRLLGPLIEYRSDPSYVRVMLRPVLSIRQARGAHDDEVRLFYPLISSHWGPEEQSTVAVGGLLDYHTTTTPDGRALTQQRFRALPFYFYDWDAERGPRVSVVPVYADREHFLGFDRVQMVLFPAYLRLQQPRVDRRFVLFPFFGASSGELGRGHALWPIYGHEMVGDTDENGFVLWPFYMWQTRADDDGVERRWASFPFYAGTSGPRRESQAYGMIFYVHELDRAAQDESWGFPWPLWVYEKNAASDARLLRLWPLYENSRQRPIESASLPSLYRYRTYSKDELEWRRGDGLFFLLRNEHSVNHAQRTGHDVESVLPIYRAVRDEGRAEGGAPALVDGIWPESEAVLSLYAPLWEGYTWQGPAADPRWSVAWGAVTHDTAGTRGPWRWEPSAAAERASESPPPQPEEHSLPAQAGEYQLPAQPDEQLLPTQPDEQ